jgi:hypothetical protein
MDLMPKLSTNLPQSVYRWFYWNTGFYRVAPRLGMGRERHKIQDPIIVFQMGKVGSSSVYISLKRLKLNVPLYDVHYLYDLEHKVELMQRGSPESTDSPSWVEDARKIRREIAAEPTKHWNLISLTRLPIPRLVSGFFENSDKRFPDMAGRYARGELTMRELTGYFKNTYRDETPLRWFQNQIQRTFGLDVYATPFDRTRGYQIYEHANIRLLVIRLEDLNRVAPQAMREFLNLHGFRIVNRNVGEAKETGTVYRDFKEALRLPREYVEHWHSSQYARHFYTSEELAASVARWT